MSGMPRYLSAIGCFRQQVQQALQTSGSHSCYSRYKAVLRVLQVLPGRQYGIWSNVRGSGTSTLTPPGLCLRTIWPPDRGGPRVELKRSAPVG